MKNLLFAFSILLFVSCSGDDDSNVDPVDDNPIINQFEDDITALSGNFYTISQLTVNGENKTMDFAGNTFSFNADGTLDSQTDLFSATGSYQYMGATMQNTNELLIISFVGANPSEPFSDLNESWTITDATVDEVSLDFSNGTDTKILIFTKS